MQGVICRLLQGRIKRGDGHESLNLPFPFYSMGREREGRWSDGAREKERRQKTPADVGFIFRGTSAQKPNRLNEGANKRVPRRMERLRRGLWTIGKEPYTDLRLSPRACLTRQARFHRGATRGELDSSSRAVRLYIALR